MRFVIIAVLFIAVIVGVVLVIVLFTRGNRQNSLPPGGWGSPGAAGGYPYPAPPPQQQAGPPAGYPLPQPNPYAPQQQPPNEWPGQ